MRRGHTSHDDLTASHVPYAVDHPLAAHILSNPGTSLAGLLVASENPRRPRLRLGRRRPSRAAEWYMSTPSSGDIRVDLNRVLSTV